MKESGWKGVAQSLKRLSVVGRQKLWKLKFWWRGFISCLKETFLVILSGLLIFLLLPLICPSLLLSGFVFSLLWLFHFCRFKMLSSRLLSLRPFDSLREWEKVFNRMISEGEKAIPILLQILQARRKSTFLFSPEPASLLAIFVFGRLKAQEAVEPLIEFLKSEAVPEVEKVAAIWALGEIRDPKAIPALIPFLGCLGLDIFDYRFEAIFVKGMATTKGDFKERLKWEVCDWAEEALTKLNSKIVVEIFKRTLEEQGKEALFEIAREYRSEVIAALTNVLDSQPEEEELDSKRKDWVFNAVWALRELKAVDALPKLRRLAKIAGSPLREYCQKVIAELEEFSRLPRAVGVGEIELANLPAIPDPSAVPTENLPRPAISNDKSSR